MTVGTHTKRFAVVLRFGVSAALLLLVGRLLDTDDVIARFEELDARWVALGLGISLLQIVVLAWRWRFTASRLGIELSMRVAVAEYYLSVLLNQLLPGGVSGDVSRAWRHARAEARTGPPVRAVVLERASAQIVMTIVAIVSLLTLPLASGPARMAAAGLVIVAVVALAMVPSIALRRPASATVESPSSLAPGSSPSLAGRVWSDTRRALLGRALPFQFSSAVLVVGSYVGVYLVAARAVGVETPFVRLLPLAAPVLMTMLIPVTVAGWGIREGAAALLWGAVGLTPEDGVAISVAYGLLVLVSSAPGVPILIRLLIGGRDQRERHHAAGSDGNEAATPGRDPEPGAG